MAEIIFITGGQRSGKSRYAQQLAEEKSANPVYLATARIWDDEFKNRIERHKNDRGKHWENLEEEKYLSNHDLSKKVVLLDCITLWLTNFFHDNNFKSEPALKAAKKEWATFIAQDFTLIVVSNEVGLGLIPEQSSVRQFVDLQGWMNQFIASFANEVKFMISGIPLTVK